jgi:hypothetical protein
MKKVCAKTSKMYGMLCSKVSLEEENLFVLLVITDVTYKTILNIPLKLCGFKNS